MNAMERPLVTIAITCYNYAEYVAEAIESALSQSYENIEVIVFNDGSTDESLKVIERYKSRVRIVSRENRGVVYTRNESLRLAKGEYLFFLDADDFFDNDYIEKMVRVAQESGADVVYPNWRVFGDDEYIKEFPEFTTQLLIEQEIHCTSESLIRLKSIDNHKFESEKVAEDWDFFLGLALAGKNFKLANNCYINYRVRKNTRGTSSSYWDDMRMFISILDKWQKIYPSLVNPVDLPISVGKRRDQFIEDQAKVISDGDKRVRELENSISEQAGVISELRQELEAVRVSHAYRFGRFILSPFAHVRRYRK